MSSGRCIKAHAPQCRFPSPAQPLPWILDVTRAEVIDRRSHGAQSFIVMERALRRDVRPHDSTVKGVTSVIIGLSHVFQEHRTLGGVDNSIETRNARSRVTSMDIDPTAAAGVAIPNAVQLKVSRVVILVINRSDIGSALARVELIP